MRHQVVRGSTVQNARAHPVLFVHGSGHAHWCYKHSFEYFAERNFDTYALNLRGHGEAGPADGVSWFQTSLGQYVEDIALAIQEIVPDTSAPQPVLIGHSLGAAAILKELEDESRRSRQTPAAVLLCAVPPYGVGLPTLRSALKNPLTLVEVMLHGGLKPLWNTPERTRHSLFTPDTPPEIVDDAYQHVRNESLRAYIDMFYFWNRPRPQRVKGTKLLFIGAEQDALFTKEEIEAAASAYHKAEWHIVPGGHDSPLLDTNWSITADIIFKWLIAGVL